MSMIATIEGLPVYNALIGDNEGMICVSLVDDPAVQSDFLAFHKDTELQMFSVADEDKRRVLGVVMRANYPIFRRTPDKGEFYMVFKPEVIRAMAQKYLCDNNQNMVDLMHDGTMVQGVEMVQWFIKDTERGVNPLGFDGIADGSLFAEYQITDEAIWQEVKVGTFKGFSLEGYFSLVPEQNEAKADAMAEEYEGKFNELTNTTKKIMAKMKRIKELLKELMMSFGEVTTDKGILAWDGDEDIKVGDKVEIKNEEGETAPAEDGEYKTEDGVVIVVKDGAVAEVNIPEEEPAEDTPAEDAPVEEAEEDAPAEEEPAEEEPQADPLAELVARLDAMDEVLAKLDERVKALEGAPAEEEAHAQYKKLAKEGNDRAVRIASALRRN